MRNEVLALEILMCQLICQKILIIFEDENREEVMNDKIEDPRNEVKVKHDDPEVEMLMWGVFMKE
jgi:hypothetical protein